MSEHFSDNRSFWDHLEEFRWRLIMMIFVWLTGAFICFSFSDAVIRYISRPVGQLIFLSLSEAFSVRFKVALVVSALAASPFWVYQVIRFLYDGLERKERKLLVWACIFFFVMSFLGGLFAHTVLAPISIRFLLSFSGPAFQPMITAEHYLSFYFGIVFFCCLCFDFPFILIWLAGQGLISDQRLKLYRRHVYVACFVVSAILTPPDVVTQLIFAVPLCCLYEFSLIGVKIALKGQN
jgi:sec-independent protein translocase protein TatC